MAKQESGTREKILAQATEVFLERGYRSATIRMIAGRAKVNSALINYYFGDKKNLYLQVIRFWAQDAFREFPLDFLDDPGAPPEEKVRSFIHHTLMCLFGPEGRGTGFGRLMEYEAGIAPSDAVHEIVSETIGRPTRALSGAIAQITGVRDAESLRIYTACVVGQTVCFYLSRSLYQALLGGLTPGSREEIDALSSRAGDFALASLRGLREKRETEEKERGT